MTIADLVLRRLIRTVPLLIGLSLIVFLMLHLAPGDAAEFALEERARQEEIIRYREYLGLDLPWYEQYYRLVSQWLAGDLGESAVSGRSVSAIISERLPRTAELLGAALVLSLCIAIPVGVISAVKRYSMLDIALTGVSFFGIAMPGFWLAILLILVFSVVLGWLPTGGAQTLGQDFSLIDHLKHLILPLMVLTLTRTATLVRYVRSSMVEVLGQDYIRTARGKGLPESQVLYRHALRNGLLPVITLIGLSMPELVGGAIITEQIFNWNGLGQLAVTSAERRDIPIVMALVMLSGVAIIIGNLAADIAYRAVDPRIK